LPDNEDMGILPIVLDWGHRNSDETKRNLSAWSSLPSAQLGTGRRDL
jgi:hypothetical protein